ncbi:efflux RND transporter permease subunit [Limibaculum sp. FT325]|uniref:efflux RND transporter permease subunit n=1 Tax=Thermohalobaculum sediminis TaxID=2939436 RepID=UPI0020BEB807|nr:efflux RND transporter permease subunit [Limibaculum sediminis]MCL5778683.1 efflux RND transporter permease subunit [Limibaculum sediminis]
MTGLTRFALDQWRVVLTLIVLVIVGGTTAYFQHPSQEDPEITIRTAVVTAQFPGMPARCVEQLLVKPIEEAARQIAEVETIESAAQTGLATVKVELRPEIVEVQPVWSTLRDKMADLAPRLPEGADGPHVNDDYGRVAVTTLALHGADYSLAELRATARWVRDRLAAVPQVSRIDIFGVQDERIWIEFDRARLDQSGLTVERMLDAIADQNLILSAGALETEQGFRYALATSGVFEDWQRVGDVPVATPSGEILYVRDLARLVRGYVDPVRKPVFFDGRPAVTLGVSMVEGAAIQSFDAALQARLAGIRADLPLGLSLDLVTHQPPIVAESVAEATENLIQTIATVLGVVILFLGIRAGAIVGAIVPLSIFMALVGMVLWDVPLHRISIAAIIIALGLLVDNGVVMAEDIKKRIDGGTAARGAALEASRTLAVPLLTSSLTTILAFLPLMLASDATGEFLRALSQVLILTLLASWLLSVTVTPVLCVRFLDRGAGQGAAQPPAPGRAETVYAGALRRVLARRGVFLAGTLAVFALALGALGRVPTGLLPPSERAQFVLNLELPAGSSESETARVAQRLALFLADGAANPEVTGSVVYVGAGGPRFFLALAPVDPAPHVAFAVVNTASADDVAPVRARVEAWMAAQLPEARGWTERLFLGSDPPGTVQIRLKGDDIDTLFQAGRAVETAFAEIGGTREIRSDWANPVLQLNVLIDQARARRADVAPSAVARMLQTKFDGTQVTDYREGDLSIPVVLRARPEDRASIDDLADSTVLSASGIAVPLLQIADLGGELQPWVVRHHQQERALTVSAVNPAMTAAALLDAIAPALDALDLGDGVRWEADGEVRAKAEANDALFATLPQCLMGIVLILIWQFNSFRRPAIILATIPLVLIGVSLGMNLMRGVLDFNAMLGILSLAGIIINNGIVLIERIDEERRAGLAVEPAVVSACTARLRPIVMTTLTTILGLLPLHLFGGELWRGMTIVMMYGLGVGTILTLFVAPALYLVLFGRGRARAGADAVPGAEARPA